MQQIRTRTTFILLVMVNLITIFIAAQSRAETPVIGFIAQDTTWTQANSPYVTLGNIIVKEGVTLTIEPGVTVQFDSGHSLTIEGVLLARGTDKQGIKFTPKGEQKPGAWGGIVFEDSSTDAKFDNAGNYISGSILQYCTVEFAETAVKANSASPFIDHCVISNSASGGIFISKGYAIVIQDSMIAHNGVGTSWGVPCGGGIYIKDSNATISNNTIIGNRAESSYSHGGGIYIDGSTGTISNNTLIGNTAGGGRGSFGGGIYVDGSTVTISNNTLTGNTAKSERGYDEGGGIYVIGGTVTISNNTITENRSSDSAAISYVGSQNITGNLIANNVAEGGENTHAVYIGGNPTFTGNTIIGNQTAYNLWYVEKKGSPNLNATNNYWGVTTEAEIRVKIYDFFADNSKAFVDVVPFLVENPLPMGSLTVTISPKALPADGVSTATITATLKDSKGNLVVDTPLTMVVSQGIGRLSEVKNNRDGTYTATYTASRTVGSEIIFISAPKNYATKSIEIQLTKRGYR